MSQEIPKFVIIGENELEQLVKEESEEKVNIIEKEANKCEIVLMIVGMIIIVMLLPSMMAVLNSIEYGYSFWMTFFGYFLLEITIFVCMCMCLCMEYFC